MTEARERPSAILTVMVISLAQAREPNRARNPPFTWLDSRDMGVADSASYTKLTELMLLSTFCGAWSHTS